MKRTLLYLSTALLTLITGLYAYLVFGSNTVHFWRELDDARVSYNGQAVSDARVYRQPDGKLLINVGKGHGWRFYLPEEKNVGVCNPIRYVPIPGYIYAKDCTGKFCPCVMMVRAKMETDAELVMQSNVIEFNSRDRQRIRVSW